MSNTYLQLYRDKLITAEKAARLVQSGDTLMYATFLGRPDDFDIALAQRRDELKDVKIFMCGVLDEPVPQTPLIDPLHEHFTCSSWFFGGMDRKLHDQNRMFYCPCIFTQLQDIIGSDFFTLDIYVQQVSPMDDYGFFSFGPANTYSLESCYKANTVILEVNENVPRVPGGSEDSIHISMIDYVIEGSNKPLYEIPQNVAISDADRAMAKILLEEMEDRSCLQLGIGALPNTLGDLLAHSDLKDLGIHTEMYADSMTKLFDQGIVTNKYKRTDRGKIAFSFALGTRGSYDFMNNNPLMASHCGRFTNDPNVIGSNDKMVAINNVLEVDLFSQVCSESAGTRHVSGTGGQVDFVLGAFKSHGGKSFLCLASTYENKKGEIKSRIVPTLQPGGIVTTPRTAVDYIVTEFGKARLKGCPTWRRAELLIEIAHPMFRDELIKEADRMKIWRKTNKI
ncbi:MAG: butyryl-CoA:acetate CoA-transferase [Syntrophomonadaceae bacterium]|jgi:acyl-CoA hydrolase|nr:butyryl-CoA:acetate CoA-transferase [Syntrophomonadaceae bacterium]